MLTDWKMNRKGLADYLRNHEFPDGIIVGELREFIYMKAAKTAGTSILHRVLRPSISGIIYHKIAPDEFQRWRDTITDGQLDEYFIFSAVRNLWERFVLIAFRYHFLNLFIIWNHTVKIIAFAFTPYPLHLYTHHHCAICGHGCQNGIVAGGF